jgi:hypothetical protein
MPGKNAWNTNLASEFHVMSVLHRLGLDANLTLGNKKAVDIAVVRDAGDAVTIDVKAVAGKVDWLVGSATGPARPRHFVVLLTYDGTFNDPATLPRVWVFPHAEFLSYVKQAKAPSTMRYVSRKEVCGARIARRTGLCSRPTILVPVTLGARRRRPTAPRIA